ncbi:hypothetical protein [Citrobacter braakii]|uniref:hypothetical protein n=1 Tax=Citrobacter braakii TaxID=57706 RepID=UPI0021CD5571|nr:hypothetical protein [Citrobacter braakii]
MKKTIICMGMICSFYSHAEITPPFAFPIMTSGNSHPVHRQITNLTDMSITWQTEDCSSIKFDDYYFLDATDDEYLNNLSPISDWQCVYRRDAYDTGYDPDVADEKPANESVVYDEKNDIWKVKKRKRQYYKDAVPLTLYNITSPNAKGYMVIDENVNKYDLQKGITKKKEVSFCMIQKTTLVALCGQGNLLKSIDGKEVDLTPYFLKSLESMTLSNPTGGK